MKLSTFVILILSHFPFSIIAEPTDAELAQKYGLHADPAYYFGELEQHPSFYKELRYLDKGFSPEDPTSITRTVETYRDIIQSSRVKLDSPVNESVFLAHEIFALSTFLQGAHKLIDKDRFSVEDRAKLVNTINRLYEATGAKARDTLYMWESRDWKAAKKELRSWNQALISSIFRRAKSKEELASALEQIPPEAFTKERANEARELLNNELLRTNGLLQRVIHRRRRASVRKCLAALEAVQGEGGDY